MKKKKNKEKENSSKFGVFNGSFVNSETLATEQEFEIENYEDDSLVIAEVKNPKAVEKKADFGNNKPKNKKINTFVYKLSAYIIILLLIILLLVVLLVVR